MTSLERRLLADVEALRSENDRLRRELDHWVKLCMDADAARSRATLELIVSGRLA
jgi:hypothetical protein